MLKRLRLYVNVSYHRYVRSSNIADYTVLLLSAGAMGNNGRGVSGVCQSGLKIIPAKFLSGPSGSGTLDNAASALYYLLNLKTRHNLKLIATSNSWGGGGFTQVGERAIPTCAIRKKVDGLLVLASR
jgi:hypothetical protein